jgi:hypothetical protein
MRLVLVVHVVAERLRRRIEDHRQMGRPVRGVELVDQLPQHGREAVDGARRLPLAVGERRQPVIGAEDIARAVDEIEMVSGHGRM